MTDTTPVQTLSEFNNKFEGKKDDTEAPTMKTVASSSSTSTASVVVKEPSPVVIETTTAVVVTEITPPVVTETVPVVETLKVDEKASTKVVVTETEDESKEVPKVVVTEAKSSPPPSEILVEKKVETVSMEQIKKDMLSKLENYSVNTFEISSGEVKNVMIEYEFDEGKSLTDNFSGLLKHSLQYPQVHMREDYYQLLRSFVQTFDCEEYHNRVLPNYAHIFFFVDMFAVLRLDSPKVSENVNNLFVCLKKKKEPLEVRVVGNVVVGQIQTPVDVTVKNPVTDVTVKNPVTDVNIKNSVTVDQIKTPVDVNVKSHVTVTEVIKSLDIVKKETTNTQYAGITGWLILTIMAGTGLAKIFFSRRKN